MALSDQSKRLLQLRSRIVEKFQASDWIEIGVLTDSSSFIEGHDRLLRSLRFGDEDYAANVLTVLRRLAREDEANLSTVENYLDQVGAEMVEAASALPGENIKAAIIRPTAFKVPDETPAEDLVSAMMPFAPQFDSVFEAIVNACKTNRMNCQRADNIWEHSTIIQDIFTLIFRSTIVVCDFTGTNPNVFYETGIAHTLGKQVIPIAQHKSELPFDLQHHRAIIYQSNGEGLATLQEQLAKRIEFLRK